MRLTAACCSLVYSLSCVASAQWASRRAGEGRLEVFRVLESVLLRGAMMGKAKTGDREQQPPIRPTLPNEPTGVNDVAQRAYDHYVARGCEHGHDVSDWLAAERELRGSSRLTV
jgi:hypothetical protein